MVGAFVSISKHLVELAHEIAVLVEDLLLAPWKFLIIVVPCRVTSPDDKVDVVFKILFNPLEGRVDKGIWRVAVRCLGAIDSSRTLEAVAGGFFIGGRVHFVERIRMYV